MGRPKKEKYAAGNVEKRQSELRLMYGSVKKEKPSPFNPNFLNGSKNTATDEVDPLERMTRDELETFINKFKMYEGKDFDDPDVEKKFFGKTSKQVLGLIDGRRLIYLSCINRIAGITIEEFLYYVIGSTRKNQPPYSEAIELITDWMYSGLVKNHRLTPEEGESGRKEYSCHGSKKLEMTEEGKQFLSKTETMLFSASPLLYNQINNAVIRREMLIKRMRKEEKETKKKDKSTIFSQDTYDTVAKMKELLGHK